MHGSVVASRRNLAPRAFQGRPQVRAELRRLYELGLIDKAKGRHIGDLRDNVAVLVKDVVTITDRGKDYLNRVWHRLTAWPDAVPGLTRLRVRYVLATLSNGNVALLTNMAKYAGLPWDCILSAELMQHYKPDPETYLGAAALLGLRPEQVMMVAAHKGDLRTAQAVGLQTAFVPRPMEWGPERTPDLIPNPAFTVHAVDFNDLAAQLS